MKAPHWYMRNWEYENRTSPDGSIRQELVYKGEYYRLAAAALPAKLLKGLYLGLGILLCLDLAVLLTHFSLGAYLFFVGGPAGLTLIPAVYLMIGCIRGLTAPEKMTYRDLYGSYYRIRMSSKWIAGLMSVCFAGELFFVLFRLFNGLPLAWSGELIWLIGGAAGAGVGFGCLLLYYRNHIDLLPMER